MINKNESTKGLDKFLHDSGTKLIIHYRIVAIVLLILIVVSVFILDRKIAPFFKDNLHDFILFERLVDLMIHFIPILIIFLLVDPLSEIYKGIKDKNKDKELKDYLKPLQEQIEKQSQQLKSFGLFSDWPSHSWTTIRKETENAQSRIYILQTWLPDIYNQSKFWQKALTQKESNVKLHVLLLDNKLVKYRKSYRSGYMDSIEKTSQELNELARIVNTSADDPKLIVKFYSCIPFGPIYIIDDDIYYGLYFADLDSMDGPGFKCNVNSWLGKLILDSWNVIWEKACLKPESSDSAAFFGDSEQKKEFVNAEINKFQFLTKLKLLPRSEAEKSTAKICILRHEETDLNSSGIISGQLNVPINLSGRKASIKLGKEFIPQRWNIVYSSPLKRCHETISLMLPSKKIKIKDELIERGRGALEGCLRVEHSKNQEIESFNKKESKGESYYDVFYRLLPFLQELDIHLQNKKSILVCSHEAPIKIMLMVMLGLDPDDVISKKIENGETFYFSNHID